MKVWGVTEMDDDTLIETLLYKGESTTVDYKVQQYPHDGATPEAKGELLKDILAFANAWRQEDAYILIGVSDSGDLVGLDKDLDDSRLQQFINGKTNSPLHFSYRSLTFKGIKLGLYTISTQDRPLYAKQSYGKIAADTVYVRRGSSTTIAKPDEIAKMGADRVEKSQKHAPNLSLQIIGPEDTLLDGISFDYKNIIIEDQDNLPDLKEKRATLDMYNIGASFDLKHTNSDYYRKLAPYIQQLEGIFGFRLQLTNSGTNFAADVRIYLTLPIAEDLEVIEEYEILNRPKRKSSIYDVVYNNVAPVNFSRRGVTITTERNIWTVAYSMGKIQSGETLSTDYVYLVRPNQSLKSITARILSDQLREPIELKIPVIINKQDVFYNISDLDRL